MRALVKPRRLRDTSRLTALDSMLLATTATADSPLRRLDPQHTGTSRHRAALEHPAVTWCYNPGLGAGATLRPYPFSELRPRHAANHGRPPPLHMAATCAERPETAGDATSPHGSRAARVARPTPSGHQPVDAEIVEVEAGLRIGAERHRGEEAAQATHWPQAIARRARTGEDRVASARGRAGRARCLRSHRR